MFRGASRAPLTKLGRSGTKGCAPNGAKPSRSRRSINITRLTALVPRDDWLLSRQILTAHQTAEPLVRDLDVTASGILTRLSRPRLR